MQRGSRYLAFANHPVSGPCDESDMISKSAVLSTVPISVYCAPSREAFVPNYDLGMFVYAVGCVADAEQVSAVDRS